jgi:hypothetical protein
MFSLVIIANPSKLRHMSVGWVETTIRTVEGQISANKPPTGNIHASRLRLLSHSTDLFDFAQTDRPSPLLSDIISQPF